MRWESLILKISARRILCTARISLQSLLFSEFHDCFMPYFLFMIHWPQLSVDRRGYLLLFLPKCSHLLPGIVKLLHSPSPPHYLPERYFSRVIIPSLKFMILPGVGSFVELIPGLNESYRILPLLELRRGPSLVDQSKIPPILGI